MLQKMVGEHQKKRAEVTDEVLARFCDVRQMPDLFAAAKARAAELGVGGLSVQPAAPKP